MREHRKTLYAFFTFLAILFVSACNNNSKSKNENGSFQNSPGDTAKIIFKTYERDFGIISEGEKVAFIFSFENAGNGSLVISSATTSCGCTVLKYDNKPIPPGESGNIEVVFDSSGKNGKQTKTVTVLSNASQPVVLLKITGEVKDSTN